MQRRKNGEIRPLTESKPLSRLLKKVTGDQVGEKTRCAKFDGDQTAVLFTFTVV